MLTGNFEKSLFVSLILMKLIQNLECDFTENNIGSHFVNINESRNESGKSVITELTQWEHNNRRVECSVLGFCAGEGARFGHCLLHPPRSTARRWPVCAS